MKNCCQATPARPAFTVASYTAIYYLVSYNIYAAGQLAQARVLVYWVLLLSLTLALKENEVCSGIYSEKVPGSFPEDVWWL